MELNDVKQVLAASPFHPVHLARPTKLYGALEDIAVGLRFVRETAVIKVRRAQRCPSATRSPSRPSRC